MATEAPTDIIERLIAEPWRIEPHTFAAHVSEGKWKPWPYLAYIGERITEAIAKGNGRLIVNMPPGHGKSELLSHWTPTWFLDSLPQQRVIAASHSDELAANFGRTVRNEFERNALLTTQLRQDSTAADRWNTPDGGGMKTTGVGGGITGFRANLILVDDPHPTWEAVNSETHRKRVIEWFNGTLRDRAEPNATFVVLMHRWHEEDLVGQLLAQDSEECQVIRFPAVAEVGDVLHRFEGEPLCPQRFPSDALVALKRAVGSLVWAGKYQQRPAPPEGNYFKRAWFTIYPRERVPSMQRVVRAWDLAATTEEEASDPDWLAGVRVGKDANGDYWILDVFRDRLSPEGVERTIRQFAQLDGQGVAIRIEREGAASGKLIGHHYTRMLDGWDARFTGIPRGTKFARSGPFNAACERGQVKLVEGEWNRDFIEEAASFPNGAHDDQIDAAVGAYSYMTDGLQEWGQEELETVFGRRRTREKSTHELLMEKLKHN
jgi:predicted phage terminase large subunit-like protein